MFVIPPELILSFEALEASWCVLAIPLLFGDILSGVGGLLSGAANIYGAISSAKGGSEALAVNRRESQLNRDWQERMSSTAHQRQVEDLRAAGLNPILSAFGGGAHVGSGAQAHVVNPYSGMEGMGTGISADITNARRLQEVEINRQKYENELMKAQTEQAGSQRDLNIGLKEQAAEQVKTLASQQVLNSATSVKAMQEAETNKVLGTMYAMGALREQSAAALNSAHAAWYRDDSNLKKLEFIRDKQYHEAKGKLGTFDAIFDSLYGALPLPGKTRR